MKYAIVYSSKTSNTKLLADTIGAALPGEDCVYLGPPDDAALAAERVYVGFWTDKGVCNGAAEAFLGKLRNKEVFLFGTAGFGGEQTYFAKILQETAARLPDGNRLIGSYMCQGRMPASVRERYVNMLAAPNHGSNLEMLIENFDKALPHPDREDLKRLKMAL